MKFLTLQISAKAYTQIGEQVYICGNVSELGNWEPVRALKMFTDPNMYPQWSSFRCIHVRQSTTIQFKLCVINSNGQVIRWQYLNNRRITVNFNMQIKFCEDVEDIHILRMQPTPRLSVRNKIDEILKDLDSDSSSSKQFWNDGIEEGFQQGPLYERNIRISMKRIIQSQSQQQIQLKFNEEALITISPLTQNSIQYIPQNYFFQFHSKTNKQQEQVQGIFYIERQQVTESLEKIKYLSNAISSQRQHILVAHLEIQSEKPEILQSALKLPLHWKTVVHISKDQIQQCLKVIEYGVNLIVLDVITSLQQVFLIFSSGGYRPKMVKPGLYVLQLKNYRRTYIYCGNSQFKEYINDLQNKQLKVIEKIKKINQLLFIHPNFIIQNRSLKENNLLLKVKNGKKVVVVTTQNVKTISSKVIKFLIEISGLKNHEVYILQQEKIVGIERTLPINSLDKMMVIGPEGEIYASGERVDSIYDTLTLSPRRFQQMYDSLIKAVGADSHCQIKNTKKNSLVIQFTADEIGQCVKKFIINSVLEMNMKSLSKVIIVNKDQINSIQIKPYCLSTDFFVKSVLNGALKPDYKNSLLLCVDYYSEQKSLNVIQRNLKDMGHISYQGFYCERHNTQYSNFCRPVITQQNLADLLSQIIEESKNAPWMRSPTQANQTDVD